MVMLGTKVLEERESKYNGHLKVAQSLGFGTYIQAEGLTQSGGIVEEIWKQTLKFLNRKQSLAKSEFGKSLIVNHCLILGLGGGTVAKLIRKNWPDAKIIGIDIDPVMIELGKRYLGLDQIDVEIKIGDALEIIQKSKVKSRKFDLIIVDLYQGDKYPEKFETENYIHLVGSLLSRGGVAIFNRLYYGDKRPETVKFGNKLHKIFSNVEWFYPEANLMFLCSL
jgi:spermidine synthase